MEMGTPLEREDGTDYLWLNIRELPFFRGLLRSIEARFYQDIDLEQPVLDLGCGDGHFTATTFKSPLQVGLDPSGKAVRTAVRYGAHQFVVQGSGCRLPFPDGYFKAAISNSVLEHIPNLEQEISEMERVLSPGALFVFSVPNQNFTRNLSVSSFFERIGLGCIAKAYRSLFNRISRHHHCDPPEAWIDRMQASGFRVEQHWNYFSPRATRCFEWGSYLGIPSLLPHFLFDRWILVSKRWNFVFVLPLLRRIYREEPRHPHGSYTFYIARRVEKFDKI